MSRSTGRPTRRSGATNQRKASAICSGGVVTRKSEVSCSTEKVMAATETPRDREKRLTVMKKNLKRMYLHGDDEELE